MRREDKELIVEQLTERLNNTKHFYLTDISGLDAVDTSDLRRKCFENDIKLIVVKNTLFKNALEKSESNFEELYDILKDSTSIMFADTANVPAKLIKEFRKENDKPLIKAAYVEETVYVGDENLDTLATLKSKEELIADVIMLLQSPAKNVISSLQSGGNKLSGIISTLSDKKE